MVTFSIQQEAILKEISNGTTLLCDARAGSAKTTTLVEGARRFNGSVVACAFNRRIANELEAKMPANAQCKTMNGLGAGAWPRRVARGVKVNLNKGKSWDIARSMKLEKCPDFANGIGLCKSIGLIPKGALGGVKGLVPDEPSTYTELISNHILDLGDCSWEVLRSGLIESIRLSWQGQIDFDDQIYMSTLYDAPLPQPEMVMVDEAQDLSVIQRKMVEKMLRNGVLISAGDRFQAIYAFRGASHDSLDQMQSLRQDTLLLPLTISFRCPKAVVEEAQKWVPDITSWDQAEEGEVRTLQKFSSSDIPPSSVILCRNNAPLIKLCFKLIRSGVGASLIGRDIGDGLVKLVKKLKASSVRDLNIKLEEWQGKEVQKYSAMNKLSQIELVEDKAEALRAVMSFSPTATSEQVIRNIERLFDPDALITLSTIHKAKGLEWPEVFILDKGLIPSRWAKTEEEIRQENNLAYVAITRAQKRLTYVESDGFIRG